MSCGEDWRKEARHSPLAMAFHGDRIAYQPLKSTDRSLTKEYVSTEFRMNNNTLEKSKKSNLQKNHTVSTDMNLDGFTHQPYTRGKNKRRPKHKPRFSTRYTLVIVKVLEFVAKKESLQLPHGFAARIAEKSNRSLRRAILSLETCRVQNYPFTDNQAISPMDWEEYVAEISTDMLREQSPKSLFQVRGKVYELLVNCIPPEVLLKRLLYELLRKLDSELKLEVCHWAAYYEHRMRLGQKAIFHIEAFVAKFMSIYKNFLISTFG
ncbi:hypothetical protein F2Q69_00056194 [Brassica cretica]|uniref:Replication factor C C-terminal domain-containing protein n=1 Tax=Brassica cretica TaxID=69181 RepID=A0A8S9MUQ4_BRACR|nr:hypothetical protein F2Q69_00056194 [Brassica cretica]